MASETRKVLGQLAPSATVLTDVYTVPISSQTIISTLVINNRGGSSTTFRVSIAVNGAADSPKQYIYYDVTINANDTFAATIGMTLGSGDVVRVFAGNANLSVTLFGVEIG